MHYTSSLNELFCYSTIHDLRLWVFPFPLAECTAEQPLEPEMIIRNVRRRHTNATRWYLGRRRMLIDRLLFVSLMGEFRQISVERIHLLLIIIVVAEDGVEHEGSAERENSDSSVHPQDLRVDKDWDKRLVECSAEGVGEEVQALDEGFHARRSLSVRVFETGDGDEDFGDANEHVSWGLDGDVDVVANLLAVHQSSRAVEWCLVAWAIDVDEVLHTSGICKRERCKRETDGNAKHWL